MYFYLIGEVLCAPEKSIIIIDEPEMHIHVSLIKRLFDLIENERPDCVFIYLTHSIDFAFSRQNAKKIWAKSYEDGKWDYEILNEAMPIPEQLYLEVLGSRLPVIFIEGDVTADRIQLKALVLKGSGRTYDSLPSNYRFEDMLFQNSDPSITNGYSVRLMIVSSYHGVS